MTVHLGDLSKHSLRTKEIQVKSTPLHWSEGIRTSAPMPVISPRPRLFLPTIQMCCGLETSKLVLLLEYLVVSHLVGLHRRRNWPQNVQWHSTRLWPICSSLTLLVWLASATDARSTILPLVPPGKTCNQRLCSNPVRIRLPAMLYPIQLSLAGSRLVPDWKRASWWVTEAHYQ